MKALLITGSTGFIGENLKKSLSSKYHIFTIGRDKALRSDKNFVLEDKKYGVTELRAWISKNEIEGVIHLASLYLKSHQSHEVAELIDSNVKLGALLLEAISLTKVKWFINTGTTWQHFQNQDYSPVNLYAATKEAFMKIMSYYQETTSIKFVTLKLNDTYGPHDKRVKILNLLDKISKDGQHLDMSGGEQLLDLSHIDDVIRAYEHLISYLENNSSLINNGSSYVLYAKERKSLREVVSIFESVSGKKLNINWGKLPYREREVMIPWEKGLALPEFEPVYDLKKGIKAFLGAKN